MSKTRTDTRRLELDVPIVDNDLAEGVQVFVHFFPKVLLKYLEALQDFESIHKGCCSEQLCRRQADVGHVEYQRHANQVSQAGRLVRMLLFGAKATIASAIN